MKVQRPTKSAALVLLAALICAVLPLSSASASVGEAQGVEEQPLRLSERRIDAAQWTNEPELWTWSRGGKAFHFLPGSSTDPSYAREIESVDLATGQPDGSLTISPGVERDISAFNPWLRGGDIAAVDEEGGRLIVGYTTNLVLDPIPKPLGQRGDTSQLANGTPCPSVGEPHRTWCFGGFHVIDMEKQVVAATVPVRLSTDRASAILSLRAIEYVPPREGLNSSGKVLMVVEEIAHSIYTVNGTVLQSDLVWPPRRNGAAIVYALQYDIETGREDWSIRLDACRGSREEKGALSKTGHQPNPASIMAGDDPERPAVFVGCHASGQIAMIVRIPLDGQGRPPVLPVRTGDEPAEALGETAQGDPAAARGVAGQNEAVAATQGPEKAIETIVDPVSQRMFFRVVGGNPVSEVWWVFDARQFAFLGTVGIGPFEMIETKYGFDRATGRLYVLAPKKGASSGGLMVADLRRSPLQQPLIFPQFAELHADMSSTSLATLSVVSADAPGDPALLLIPALDETRYHVIEDRLAVPENPPFDSTYAGRTLDLDEVDGVTQAVFDGAGRGYGARMIWVAGAEAATRAGALDPVGQTRGVIGYRLNGKDPVLWDDQCLDADRELVVGMIGYGSPAALDVNGGRATVRPLVMDSKTSADVQLPATRCGVREWEDIWGTALFGQPPTEEPRADTSGFDGSVECSSSTLRQSSFADPVVGAVSAAVHCPGEEEANGWSRVRGLTLGEEAQVGETVTSFRIYRDPDRGVVSRVEAVVRAINIPGFFKAEVVRASAESWANGRRQPVAEAEREAGYEPNCDLERTAGSCFRRAMFGVWTPGYACGPCGDEAALKDGLNRGLGTLGQVRFRDPDPVLARGAENGFIAAVQKPDHERFGDLVMNNDLLQSVVPSIELIRIAPPSRVDGGGRRGRQLYQFAGVEVSSSYAVQCLLVYDEATNTCAGEKQTPGSIQVSLSDSDGKPLAGGGFEVRADVDVDGVLGLKDTLLPEGACVTAEDGVGTCTLDNLQPGTYLVSQVAAPPGYAKSAEPFVVELASGEQRTVAFTNVSNVSTIDLKVTDENGAPLSGATFAAYPDEDSDGKVAPDAKPAAECTTDSAGVCQMKVPAGSYVLVQTAAPGGLEGIEPVPFTFASGGQVAAVTVVNYPPGAPAQPAPPASPVYTPPVDYAPPTEIVDDYSPVPDVPVIVEPPAVSVPERIGGTVTQVIRAPGDALRLLARDPKQAVAWTAALALFVIAAMAVRRRQQAIALIQG